MRINLVSKRSIIAISAITILLFSCYLLPSVLKNLWESAHSDVQNVTVSGYVYDKDKKAMSDYTLYITNYYYEGGDYDGFGGSKVHQVVSDENGYYELKLDKSAFIQIDSVKEGYTKSLKDKYIYDQSVKIDFYIK
ncbi:hypothetical protein [Zooshikella sp. RANM57]|uniref:hypothetical protein n=1 Tax=Zooshikella sp. RANM57 TaxID=3425863 RepID=UPI003D6DBDC7